MFNQNNQQQCRKFWQLARTITPSDLIALWCNQEPSEFNAFLANTGYLPSCADAKKALLLEALENKELDYIDDGLPYNGGLWIGGNIAELLAKNRIRLEKDKAKTWIISLHKKGNLGGLPNFLLDDLNTTTANDDSQQQIADLQADNARLQARITQLESQLNQAKENAAPAFDTLLDTGHEYHAPDLAYAVRLWLDIYANGKPKDDSHTNLANVWIGKHTNYNTHDDGYQMMQNRIREIATPLKDFGKKRIKESKK